MSVGDFRLRGLSVSRQLCTDGQSTWTVWVIFAHEDCPLVHISAARLPFPWTVSGQLTHVDSPSVHISWFLSECTDSLRIFHGLMVHDGLKFYWCWLDYILPGSSGWSSNQVLTFSLIFFVVWSRPSVLKGWIISSQLPWYPWTQLWTKALSGVNAPVRMLLAENCAHEGSISSVNLKYWGESEFHQVKISNLWRRLLRYLNFFAFSVFNVLGRNVWLERGGSNLSDKGLNLSGSWQQGHSATYNTPSRI